MPKTPTIDDVRGRLKTRYAKEERVDALLLDGDRIGRVVQYGKHGARGGVRTVYAARGTYLGQNLDDTEAGSVRAVLGKVATLVARALREQAKTSAVA